MLDFKEVASQPLASLSRRQLLDIMQTLTWVHEIDVGEGIRTPGRWGRGNPEVWKACDQIDFAGKKVLDIGCWDGLWTFEAEHRGAALVVGTDLISQRPNSTELTFRVAAALRNSSALFVPNISVYDIEGLSETFDIIFYLGVFYHLKDPLRSFTCLRRSLSDGGSLVVEGAVLDKPGSYANFYYRDSFYGDNTNWWIPTRDCLRQWVECSFMKVVWDGAAFGDSINQRHCLIAEGVRGKDPLYSAQPEYLEDFNSE